MSSNTITNPENLKSRVIALQKELERKRQLLKKAEVKVKTPSHRKSSSQNLLLPVPEEVIVSQELTEKTNECVDLSKNESEPLVEIYYLKFNNYELRDKLCTSTLRSYSCVLNNSSHLLLLAFYNIHGKLSLYLISSNNGNSMLLWEKRLNTTEVILLEIIFLPHHVNLNRRCGLLTVEKCRSTATELSFLVCFYIFKVPLILDTDSVNCYQNLLEDVHSFPLFSSKCSFIDSPPTLYHHLFLHKDTNLMFVICVPQVGLYAIFQLSSVTEFLLVLKVLHRFENSPFLLNDSIVSIGHCLSNISTPCIMGIHFSPHTYDCVGYLFKVPDSNVEVGKDFANNQFSVTLYPRNSITKDVSLKPCSKLLLVDSVDSRALLFSIIMGDTMSSKVFFMLGLVTLDDLPKGIILRLVSIDTPVDDFTHLGWILYSHPNSMHRQCLLRILCTAKGDQMQELKMYAWSIHSLIHSSEQCIPKIFSNTETHSDSYLFLLYHYSRQSSFFSNAVCSFFFDSHVNKIFNF